MRDVKKASSVTLARLDAKLQEIEYRLASLERVLGGRKLTGSELVGVDSVLLQHKQWLLREQIAKQRSLEEQRSLEGGQRRVR